jgi:hypothetical protein
LDFLIYQRRGRPLCLPWVERATTGGAPTNFRRCEMIVLSPEGKAQSSAAKVASVPQFADLRGKVIGLLDNSKPNADKLAERFAELLKEKYGVAKVISRRKLTAQQGAPKQYLDELASQADFVISGLGD